MYADVRLTTGACFDFLLYKNKEDCEKQKSNKGFFKVVIEPNNTAVIYYMYVKPKHRNMGYAKFVIDDLKTHAQKIMTQISASADSSVEFLKKQDFKAEGDWLVWQKTE